VANTAQRLADSLIRELHDLEIVATAGASIGAAGNARLLESVLVKSFTEFESFLEELFFALLTGRARPGEARPYVRIRDIDVARGVVLQPQERYLTWLPIQEAVERAARFLENGRPFDRLIKRQAVVANLRRAQIIRNATAHKSAHAQTLFVQETGAKFATPGDFLAATSGGSTMCEALLADLARYGEALVRSDAEAERLLGLADPVRTGQRVDAGTYTCQTCARSQTVTDGARLECGYCDAACPHCGRRGKTATFQPVP
jgi:hypothetical protein